MDIMVEDIAKYIEQIAPKYLMEDWDNSGFLVGNKNEKVSGIIVALDITQDVIKQAKKAGANMIVSHHPVIFNPIKEITNENNSIIYELITNGINAYCAHTTLDNAQGGVNDYLANKLELKDTLVLEEYKEGQGTGRIGLLKRNMDAQELAAFVKQRLEAEYIRYADAGNTIKKVAVVGGSGASFIDKAIDCGADALITGDIKHHDVLYCLEKGLTIIDATHFATEQIVKDRIFSHLQSQLNKVQYSIALLKADEIDNMRILV